MSTRSGLIRVSAQDENMDQNVASLECPQAPPQSAGTQPKSLSAPQPAALLPIDLVQQLLMAQQQQLLEANLVAQREQREATLVLQREQREAQKEEREAYLAALRDSQTAQQERLMQFVESSMMTLRESNADVPQQKEGSGDRTDEVRTPTATPRRNIAPQDQVSPQIPRSVLTNREEGIPQNLIISGPSGMVHFRTPVTRSLTQDDRIENTMRDGRENQFVNPTCGDQLGRDIPSSPHGRNELESTQTGDGYGKVTSSLTRMNNSNTVKLSTFDGTTPWSDYERQFLMIADHYGWDSINKATNLAANLRGAALSILSSLSTSEIYNYGKLRAAIQLRYGNEHLKKLYMTQLQSRRQNKEENLSTLGQDIERLSRVAMPDNEVARDFMATTAFINAIFDSELKLAVSLTGPSSLREALIKALEVEALTKHYTGSLKLRQVEVPSPIPDEKTKTNRTKPAPGPRHSNNNNRNNNNNANTKTAGINGSSTECKFCKRPGHDVNHCFTLDRYLSNQSNGNRNSYQGQYNQRNNYQNNDQNSWRNSDRRQDTNVQGATPANESKN